MNRHTALAFVSLLILVVALPLYALGERARLDAAQGALRQEMVMGAADLYLRNCAECHGAAGEGLAPNPPLNTPGLAGADADFLFQLVGHAPHGTAMGVWHVAEGGPLNSYQIESLVTLIRGADWEQVAGMARLRGAEPTAPQMAADVSPLLGVLNENDPHRCAACHEDPDVHAERFGLDCARCHGLSAWKPALLVRHVFHLDHGAQEPLDCQTCHIESYAENTCYGCHDHQPDDMVTIHLNAGEPDFADCASCHPTGTAADLAVVGH